MAEQTQRPRTAESKRLTALETGIASLALALTANGIDVPEGADPIVVAITSLKDYASQRAQVASLADALLEHHPDAIDGSGGAIECAIKILSQPLAEETGGTTAEDTVAALEARIDELERAGQVKDSRIAALEGGDATVIQDGASKPEETDAPAPLERPETAGDVGPDYPGLLNSAELRELIGTGELEQLEIAFSNGDFEIVTLQRVPISPADMQSFEGRNVVGPAIHAKLTPKDAPETLAGFGLMLQGEQIAYCAALDPIKLEPGVEHRFHRAIFF